MRVHQQVLIPGLQHADEANLCQELRRLVMLITAKCVVHKQIEIGASNKVTQMIRRADEAELGPTQLPCERVRARQPQQPSR